LSVLKFSDGVQFDTSGEYRIEKRYDGYYVTGHGMLSYAGETREEAERELSGFTKNKGGAN